MPAKNFLDTASSKKKFEDYKPATRRNSTSNPTLNIPNPEGRNIVPAKNSKIERKGRRTEKIDD